MVPHSENPAGSALSALAQMRVERKGSGPCCFPCHRFRSLTEQYHEWTVDTVQWPICTDPEATSKNSFTWQYLFCVCMIKMRGLFIWCLLISPRTMPPIDKLFLLYSKLVLLSDPAAYTGPQRCKLMLHHYAYLAESWREHDSQIPAAYPGFGRYLLLSVVFSLNTRPLLKEHLAYTSRNNLL